MREPIKITHPNNENVFVRIGKGHYITANAHINYYVGTTDIKHNHETSSETAKMMADYYKNRSISVDTVLCLYETQSLGAYLAHELARPTMMDPNPKTNIYMVGPEYDVAGNMIFRDNLKRMIENKKVLILISCITSGKTIERAIESIEYYGGNVVGISAVFSATKNICGIDVNTVFTESDLPGYEVYNKHDCPLCRAGVPVTAIANGYGYSRL